LEGGSEVRDTDGMGGGLSCVFKNRGNGFGGCKVIGEYRCVDGSAVESCL
jgi:hypothetical protein